jgi:hypothetical protein
MLGTAPNLPEPACHGSLLLSLKQRPDVSLYRIDGSQILATELPLQFSSQALNPPYLSHRLMPKESARFLLQNYSGSHYDLYAAFMESAVRLMADHGRLAMICQQSFLTTARYEELRRRLVDRCRINSIVQLGPGSFDSRAGEKVNNAIISLSNSRSENQFNDYRSIRTYNIVSGASKSIAEQDGIKALQNIEVDEMDFLSRSRMIPGFPLAGLCPAEVANLFEQLPTISKGNYGITLTNGLFTCDNKRFIRHFTEIDSSTKSETTFVPYDKGGGQKWFSTTPYLLEWKDEGNEIREFRAGRGQSRALPGERFYFRTGITYSYIGTKGFKARLLSPGSVFDIASSALFSDQIDLHYMLGFLNSALVRFILGTLNPTINFQIGDLRRIPMRIPAAAVEREIAALATEAVNLAREADRLNPASPAFVSIPHSELIVKERSSVGASSSNPNRETPNGYGAIVESIMRINQREAVIQEQIDEAVFNLYEISATTRDIILQNEWVARTKEPLINTPSPLKFLAR